MKTYQAFVLAIGLLTSTANAQGQTLRWASQGDVQSMDPHAHNETLTNSVNGQVYEALTTRDKQLRIVPQLAESWSQVTPLKWRFKLRPRVTFHDGTPLTADDIVFSYRRATESNSDFKVYASAVGTPVKIDDQTVEFNLKAFDPIFLQHASATFIMSKAWCEQNHSTSIPAVNSGQQNFATLHANGTGPFMLVSRQPDVKTVFRRNPNWWGRFEGNLQEVIYTPIKNPSTRVAALVSGELDFILDPPPADMPRLRQVGNINIIEGPENRIIFIGMDQGRDELLYSSVKGKNPFKDLRVRKAMYQAIDEEHIKYKLMRGMAAPTGATLPTSMASYNDHEIERRLPFDPTAARALLVEAGYPAGFDFTLDCPNDRYVNDGEICAALASMWARIGLNVRVNAMPRTLFFPKLGKLDVSAYLLGWGGAVTDAENTLTPIYRHRGEGGVGDFNYGNFIDPELDHLAAASSHETDPVRREALVKAALRRHNEQVHHIPLHRQVIAWAARRGVEVVHRADNWLEWSWIRVD